MIVELWCRFFRFFSLTEWTAIRREYSVWIKSAPGQKYYKFHEPDSDEITGKLNHFRV